MKYYLAICCVLFLTSCSQTSEHAGKTSTTALQPVAFNVPGAPTVEFNAPDMMCPEGCGEKVKEILSGQPGAKEVVVDFDAKKAKVAIDDSGKFDPKAAVAALVDHGFANSSVVGDEHTADPKPEAPADKAKDNGAG